MPVTTPTGSVLADTEGADNIHDVPRGFDFATEASGTIGNPPVGKLRVWGDGTDTFVRNSAGTDFNMGGGSGGGDNLTTILGVGDTTGARNINFDNAASRLQFTRTGVLSINAAAQVGTETLTLPDPGGSDTVVYATLAQTLAAKTLTTPTVGSFVNAEHTHAAAGATGGTIAHTVLTAIGTVTHAQLDQRQALLNGGVLETAAVTVTSDGATVLLNLEQVGTGDLTLYFSTGEFVFDSTPIATVSLTPGSDTSPTLNYVYVLESTKALTVSTSFWPAAEHVPIATVNVQSAGGVQTDGAYKVHAWTDHLSEMSDNGHISHVNAWIRNQHSRWISGVALTPTVAAGGVFDVATTSGVVLQLHDHVMPARDTGAADSIFVVNDPVTAFKKVGSLGAELTDSLGVGMNNRRFNMVVWAVINEATSDCKLMCNLPDASYNSNNPAIADDDKTANYNIPTTFTGTSVLIARLTIRHQTTGDTFSLLQNEDLRGQIPSTFAGGTAATVTEFADNAFKLFDEGDNTKIADFQLSGFTTGNTRTFTLPDVSDTVVTLGATQTLTAKTLTTPTIASLTNAQHTHQDAAGAGILAAPGITSFANAIHDHTNAAGGGLLGGFGDTIIVASSGGDHTTIAAAITASSSGDVILVYPGTYAEANPLTVKAGTSIIGVAGEQRILVTANTAANDGFVLLDGALVSGITMSGTTGGSAAAFKYSGTTLAFVEMCAVDGAITAYHNTSTGALQLVNCTTTGTGNIGTLLLCAGGLLGGDLITMGHTGTITTGMQATGGEIQVSAILIDGATTGLFANGGDIIAITGDILNCTTGVRVAASSKCTIFNIRILTSTGEDLQTDAATSEIVHNGCEFRREGISQFAASTIIGLFIDSTLQGEQSTNIFGEFSVGAPGVGSETTLGEGDSYTKEMQVFVFDNSAASGSKFTDVTTAAASISGSTITLLDNLDAFIIAGPREFGGVKVNIDTLFVPTVADSTAFIWQYWDGSAWVDFNAMEAEDLTTKSNANAFFETNTGDHQIMFDDRLDNGGVGGVAWVADDNTLDLLPNFGTNLFAIKVRISAVLGISTAVKLEQVKLHADHLEIEADGWIKYIGRSRWREILPIDTNTFDSTGSPPSNENIDFSTNITIGRLLNRFNASATDIIATYFPLPAGLDTSSPLELVIEWYPVDAVPDTNTVTFDGIYGVGQDGTVWGGANTETIESVAVASPSNQNQTTRTTILLEIPTALKGDGLALAIRRIGTSDASSNDVVVTNISLFALKHLNGVHIE